MLKNGVSKTLFEDLAWVHAQAGSDIHGLPSFLPWHRVFLGVHDNLMRTQCNYTGQFPYWDWTFDSQAPEISPIWNSFGKATNGCLSISGLGSGSLYSNVPNRHCITRKWADSKLFSSQYSSTQMQAILNSADYNTFRRSLESAPHNSIHVAIGGDMGSTQMSPNDPIFYMHHRNIDRNWWKWQQQNPTIANTYSGTNRSGAQVRVTDTMKYFGLIADTTVQQGLNSQSNALNGLMCFKYSNSITSAAPTTSRRSLLKRGVESGVYNPDTPKPTDREDLDNVRVPKPIDEDFLIRTNYTKAEIAAVRKTEDFISRFSEYLNTMPLLFPETLGKQLTAATSGYRKKTDAEEKAETKLAKALLKAFGESIQL
jgi:hypothetical protein